jgi:ABC-type uncharacterized transport system ATPase subunit
MIGRELPVCEQPAAPVRDEVRLSIDGLSWSTEDPFGTTLESIRLRVHGGEIVGIAGISGNGQKELLALLGGEQPLTRGQSAQIRIDGREVGHLNSAARRDLRMTLVPEERLGRGVVASMTLAENGLLTAHRDDMVQLGIVRPSKVDAFAERCVRSFDVRCAGIHAEARSLSGGNLQKFIVGREILQSPRVLIAAQPTWGVDVGAAAAIRQALIALRDEGVAVLVISEDLEELFEISDRIAVIVQGRLTPARPTAESDMEAIGLLMGGILSHGAAEAGSA